MTKATKQRQKKLTLTSCQKIMTSLSFLGFLSNLEQSGGQIPDTKSAKVLFSVIKTFFFPKMKTELKNRQHSSHTIALSKGTFLYKKR